MSSLVGNTQVVAGGPEMMRQTLDFLESQGTRTKGNPDMLVRVYKHFGIEEARELRSRASLKPLGARRVFVVAAADINREAQNALLKTLEEPSSNALFIFIVPSPQTLLPTLRSRMQTLDFPADFASPNDLRSPNIRTLEFLRSTPQKRLELLRPLLEKGDDDRRDLGAIIGFLAALEKQLEKSSEGHHVTRREGIESAYRARKYITDRGALVKPLLEQVALLVPRI